MKKSTNSLECEKWKSNDKSEKNATRVVSRDTTNPLFFWHWKTYQNSCHEGYMFAKTYCKPDVSQISYMMGSLYLWINFCRLLICWLYVYMCVSNFFGGSHFICLMWFAYLITKIIMHCMSDSVIFFQLTLLVFGSVLLNPLNVFLDVKEYGYLMPCIVILSSMPAINASDI